MNLMKTYIGTKVIHALPMTPEKRAGRGVSHKLGYTRQQRAAPRKNLAKGLNMGS